MDSVLCKFIWNAIKYPAKYIAKSHFVYHFSLVKTFFEAPTWSNEDKFFIL